MSSLHLVRGDDESLVSQAVHDIVSRLVGDGDHALVVAEFDGDDYDLAAVLDAARTPPFLTERRVVVARGIGRFTAEQLVPLASYVADPTPTTDLVLAATGERLPKLLLDALKNAGAVVEDVGARTAKDRRDWLEERFATAPVRLDTSAKALVSAWLGEDLGRLSSLFETLEGMAGPGARLTADDVAPYLGTAGSVPPWDLTDAIDRGDTAAALGMLARMSGAGGRHPLVVMAILHGHYGRMLRLDGAGITDRSTAASVLKTAPFQGQKALEQSRRLGHDGVVRAMTLLAQADLDLRGAKDWPEELVMEVLVARLSRLLPAKTTTARR